MCSCGGRAQFSESTLRPLNRGNRDSLTCLGRVLLFSGTEDSLEMFYYSSCQRNWLPRGCWSKYVNHWLVEREVCYLCTFLKHQYFWIYQSYNFLGKWRSRPDFPRMQYKIPCSLRDQQRQIWIRLHLVRTILPQEGILRPIRKWKVNKLTSLSYCHSFGT